MRSFYFLVSRISHIATARVIASDYFNIHKTYLIVIGQFSGVERAILAAKKDTIWGAVETSKALTIYLKEFDNSGSDIFIYSDFGMRINYHLYYLHTNNRIHLFQDGSANYLPATRKFKAFNYIYSFLMGDGLRFENFVGQSRFISSLFLYDKSRFKRIFKGRNIKVFSIGESFLQSINMLAKKSYIEKYNTEDNIKNKAILYLPGWSVNPILVKYIVENFNGVRFIKKHPADEGNLSYFSEFTSIESHYIGEQVICELMLKFTKVVVILESEASSYAFSEVENVDFYLARMLKNNEIYMEKLCIKKNESINYS
jgi:hypothetical protein